MNKRFRRLVLGIAMSMSVASYAQVADFSFAFGSGQCAPAVVSFTNTSANIAQITAINWDFGDGSPYATDTSIHRVGVQKIYSAAGTYTVTLTVWWDSVSRTVTKTVDVFQLYAVGEIILPAPPEKPAGCVPLSAGVWSNFDSLRTSSPVTDYIWRWDYFGDSSDTTNTGTTMIGIHTYHDTGVFHVSLTVVNQQGCRYDAPVGKFAVGVQPVVNFTYDFDQKCNAEFSVNVQAYDSLQGGNLVNVTNYTSPKTNITYGAARANDWRWYELDNPMAPIATGDTTAVAPSLNIGYRGVCLEPLHNGCAGNWVCKDSIGYICPPIARIDYPKDNADGTKPVFCNYPNFCDNNGNDMSIQAELYNLTGNYNGGMKYEWYMGDTVSRYVISPDRTTLGGMPPANYNGQTKFTGYMNFDPITGNLVSNSGDINPCFDYTPADSLRKDPNFYLYQNGGVVVMTLIVSNWDTTSNEYLPDGITPHPTYNRCGYCEDYATQVILISDAVVNFTADKYDVCQGDNVQFYDSTFCIIPMVCWGFGPISAANPGNVDYPIGYYVPPSKDSVRLPQFIGYVHVITNPIPMGGIYPRVRQGFGLSFNKPNVYSFEMVNMDVFGCSRADTIEVSVNPSYRFTSSATIYEGANYLFRGQTYSVQGIYHDSSQTIHGCDSIFELILTVNPPYHFTDSATICEGMDYIFRGRPYSVQGYYYDSSQTMLGCDSIFELILTVNPTYIVQISDSFYAGNSYNFFGRLLTESGIYYDTLPTIRGCDSVICLTLTRLSATISGKIYCQSQTSLSSGAVMLYRLGNSQYSLENTVSIENDGSYLFTDVSLGNYIIKASVPDSGSTISAYYGNTEFWYLANTIKITNNLPVDSINITLISLPSMSGSSFISGYVGEDNGQKSFSQKSVSKPAEDVNVYLQREQSSTWKTVAQTLTNEDGYFEFRNVPAGRYRLILDVPGLTIDKPSIINVGDGDTITDIEYEITEDGIINKSGNNVGIVGAIGIHPIQIFPNPAQSELFIKSDLQIEKVEIYTVVGSLVLSESNFRDKISVSSLPIGFYLLKIYTDNGVVVKKFVKE